MRWLLGVLLFLIPACTRADIDMVSVPRQELERLYQKHKDLAAENAKLQNQIDKQSGHIQKLQASNNCV